MLSLRTLSFEAVEETYMLVSGGEETIDGVSFTEPHPAAEKIRNEIKSAEIIFFIFVIILLSVNQ